MSHKFIFPQMFDVRPRDKAGDLDLEKIKKIAKILNLKINEPLNEIILSERTIDLKNQLPGIYVESELSEKRKRKVKKSAEIERGMSNFDFWPEYYKETDLTQSQAEILSVLEMVEATDQAFKNPVDEENVAEIEEDEGQGEELIYGIPVRAVGPTIEGSITVEVAGVKKIPETVESEELFFREPEVNHESQPELTLEYERPIPRWLQQKESEFSLHNEIIAPELLLNKRPKIYSFKWQKAKKPILIFTAAAVLIFSFFPIFSWFNKVLVAKNEALNSGMAAYQSLINAKGSLEQFNFVQAEKDFKTANDYFSAADSQIRGAAGWLVFVLERIPGVTYFSSRTKLVKVGQDMSEAGQSFASIASLFGNISLNLSKSNQNPPPMPNNLTQAKNYLEDGLRLLVSAKQNLEDIKISSLPKDIQPNLVSLQDYMPQIVETAALALDWTDNFLKILGHENAKKYLLIFQNNAEARPTGGFVGTYGILDLDQGQIKNLFIDGIYNPDGQLKEKIIPPAPIQKVSTAWSTHDANWFADFPISAQKIMWFYEKTGGPTVDGVISLTPTVIERLLEITGPIQMPEYGVVLDSKNFVDVTQYEAEVNYDKTLNQPKKILANFAPKFIDKIAQEIENNNLEVLKTINQSLKEKHILVYFSDQDLEQFVKQQEWGGEILSASGDYLAIVNTNINGFKTDRVVKEDIKYVSEIYKDGSIINTVSVTRRHQGGKYDWYNKVNADYLRVYVPKGSELLFASGQTREDVKPPIDYYQAGFKPDPDVLAIEQSMKIDVASGTQIFEESGKTVFGNWVYVSPGESATLIYKYCLPFKLNTSRPVNFSLTAQKQSGSIGSSFSAQFLLPQNCRIVSGNTNIDTDLEVDRKVEFNLQCVNQ